MALHTIAVVTSSAYVLVMRVLKSKMTAVRVTPFLGTESEKNRRYSPHTWKPLTGILFYTATQIILAI